MSGTRSTTPYNHCSLLVSLEDVWRLPYADYAASPSLNRFGLDVYNNGLAERVAHTAQIDASESLPDTGGFCSSCCPDRRASCDGA